MLIHHSFDKQGIPRLIIAYERWTGLDEALNLAAGIRAQRLDDIAPAPGGGIQLFHKPVMILAAAAEVSSLWLDASLSKALFQVVNDKQFASPTLQDRTSEPGPFP